MSTCLDMSRPPPSKTYTIDRCHVIMLKPMTHSPDLGAESRRQITPVVGVTWTCSSNPNHWGYLDTMSKFNLPFCHNTRSHRPCVWLPISVDADFWRRLSAPKCGLCVMGFRHTLHRPVVYLCVCRTPSPWCHRDTQLTKLFSLHLCYNYIITLTLTSID